jgi:RNA polymerase sigma-70 factor (ECF subfamily)
MTDEASIARMRSGDIGGLAWLVETYQLQGVRTAYLIVRDRSLAEDIVQAAFIRAFERIGQFKLESRFGPWFLKSVARDAIKAAERGRRMTSIEPGWANADTRTDYDPFDEAPGPAAVLEHVEDAAALWALLDRLPPVQRAVIVLRYYVGLTDAEIADHLDTPRATVRWQLFAARGRLRTWLAERVE